MTFDDTKRLTFPPPQDGDRICDANLCKGHPLVALVVDLSRPGYEYRCPRCGTYSEFFGARYTAPAVRRDAEQNPPEAGATP